MAKTLKDQVILIKGAGEMATGVACRLFGANIRRILMLETPSPLAVRRQVSFCEVVHDGVVTVEGIKAILINKEADLRQAWKEEQIAVRVDPHAESIKQLNPDVIIDATLAKKNLGITISDAPLVIGLGPGFEAGTDCHIVIETNRGHDLGRIIRSGKAEANTGIPGDIGGFTKERVVRAPASGLFVTEKQIGDQVRHEEIIGQIGDTPVLASIDGILRGLIRPGSKVTQGLKISDIDPRGNECYCNTISEKARTISGTVLEAILSQYNQ